jgi:hypothetical protein
MKRLVLALLVAVSASARSLPPPGPETQAVLAVLFEQQKYMRREDVAGVMGTILPDSPLAVATEALLKRVQDSYDFRFEFSDEAVKSISATEAEVNFTQITERVSGPEFRKNRIRGTHVLRKDAQGKWKFFDTKIHKVDYLDR